MKSWTRADIIEAVDRVAQVFLSEKIYERGMGATLALTSVLVALDVYSQEQMLKSWDCAFAGDDEGAKMALVPDPTLAAISLRDELPPELAVAMDLCADIALAERAVPEWLALPQDLRDAAIETFRVLDEPDQAAPVA